MSTIGYEGQSQGGFNDGQSWNSGGDGSFALGGTFYQYGPGQGHNNGNGGGNGNGNGHGYGGGHGGGHGNGNGGTVTPTDPIPPVTPVPIPAAGLMLGTVILGAVACKGVKRAFS